MLKIKLSPIGKRRAIKYRIVVVEENSKITGAPTDLLGYYLPEQKKLEIDRSLLQQWLDKGAQPTPGVRKLLTI